MIYFITESNIHQVINVTDELIISNLNGITEFFLEHLNSIQFTGFDTETTGKRPLTSRILLAAFGNEIDQFVFDTTNDRVAAFCCVAIDICNRSNITLIGSNLKFDYSMVASNWNIRIKLLYDLMIVDQRITLGCGKSDKNPNGYSYRLDEIIKRHLGFIPAAMDKDIRKEFIGANPETFIFKNYHITYSAGDIGSLHQVKAKQEVYIKQYRMEFLIYNIELPLIRVLAEAEIEGFVFNAVKWRENIKINKDLKFELELKMDKEIRRLRDTHVLPEKQSYLKGGKFDRVRNRHPEVEVIDLFGEVNDTKKGKEPNSGNTNYNSTSQLVDLFARLEFPLPTKRDIYVVPQLSSDGKIANKNEEFTTNAKILEVYLIDNYGTEIHNFVKDLIKYRETNTRINTFGEEFINQFMMPNGKVYTIFRQTDAVNGRLQSGDSKSGFYNCQNIPRDKVFRECFGVEPGYSVSTHDLKGAEVIIMAAKAQDFRLLELASEDIHSHMAQAGWRNIFLFRAGLRAGCWINAKEFWKLKDNILEVSRMIISDDNFVIQNYSLSQTYIISKDINNDKRQASKNVNFATIYGCSPKRAARTISVSVEEGAIYIGTVEREIPATFKMVERNVKFAIGKYNNWNYKWELRPNGYLILNERTNSRIWFPNVLHAVKNNIPPEYHHLQDADGQARNTPISGTQADGIKEAMVEIHQAFEDQGLFPKCKILKQVHDELVVKHPLNMDGKSEEWNTNPQYITFTDVDYQREVSVPEFVNLTMSKCMNRYLKNVKMGVDTHVKLTWTK